MEMIEHGGSVLAMILRRDYRRDGIQFFTPPEYSQQLGYMNRPSGYVIPAHVHNPVSREVQQTSEVLFVRSGRVRVDFYTEERSYVRSVELQAGDVILLVSGGHGFEMLEDCEMIEVKQGPHVGDADKTRFTPDRGRGGA